MRRFAITAAMTLMLALLGACGGSDDDGSSPSAGGAGSSGDGSKASDAAKVLDTCKAISVDEVGAIIGGTFTSELGPFDACEFDQEDPRATSFSLDSQLASELGGGFEAYRSGSKSAFTGGKEIDVPGVGDEAFITTGTFAEGTNIQLQGAALVDGQVLTVTLTQGSGIAEDVLVDQATELLTLVASKV